MKKIIFLSAFIIMLFCIPASAEEYCIGTIDIYDYTATENEDDAMLMGLSETEKAAAEAIALGVENCKAEVDISDFRIPVDRTDILRDVYHSVIMNNPQYYYMSTSFRYTYMSNTGYISKILLNYIYTKSPSLDAVIEQEKEKVLSLIDKSMTDVEKVIVIHNYLVANFDYDYTYTVYNIYDMFVNRKAVCQGYTLAATYFMQAVGVECSYAESSDMSHIWNMVCIDGNWYHMDVTWDDPTEVVGYCSYEYFLKSDTYFNNNDHYGWTSDYTAENVRYDEFFLTNYSTPVLYQNGQWFVQEKGTLYKIDLLYGIKEAVYTPPVKSISGWYLSSDYLNYGVYGDALVYNTYDGIYVIYLNDYSAEARKIISYDNDDYNINALAVSCDTLYYQTGSSRYAENVVTNTVSLVGLVSPYWFKINVNDTESGVSVAVEYAKDWFDEKEHRVWVAAYDENNTLIYIRELTDSNTLENVPKGAVYKAFIWNELTPLCDSVDVKTD